jgi:hypothetical protein
MHGREAQQTEPVIFSPKNIILSPYNRLSENTKERWQDRGLTVSEATLHVISWGLRTTLEIISTSLDIIAIQLIPVEQLFGPRNALGLVIFAPDRGPGSSHRRSRGNSSHVAPNRFHVHVRLATAVRSTRYAKFLISESVTNSYPLGILRGYLTSLSLEATSSCLGDLPIPTRR